MKNTEPLQLGQWMQPGFKPHLGFFPFGWLCCGSAFMAMVTGNCPRELERQHLKGRNYGVSSRRIRRILDSLGWESREIGIYGISNLRNDADWKGVPWHFESCLFMVGAWSTKTDQSWFLVHGGKIYHNGELWDNAGASFALCNPVTDIVILRKKV